MKVVFFQRKPYQHNHSIEKIFDTLRTYLPDNVEKKVFIPKHYSRGIWKRVYSIFEAYFHQGDINHITGDIHFVSFLLNRRKTILTVHSIEGGLKKMTRTERFLFKLLWFKIPSITVKKVTTVSAFLKEELIKYVNCPADKIVVIPNPVFPVFQYSPKTFDTKKTKILHIGTKTNKNINRLIEAIKDIPCHLTIIGNSFDHAPLELHNIDYTILDNLSREEMYEVYKQTDIVSVISTYEGFGMPIIEAQAVGRVVITSNITAMPEVAGSGACIIDPYNIESVKMGFLKIIGNQSYREELLANGLENVKRFRPKAVADSYYECYESLL